LEALIDLYKAKGWLRYDFKVIKGSEIENDVSLRLGFRQGSMTTGQENIPQGANAVIRRGLSNNGNMHSNLGYADGTFRWESWDGGQNRIDSPSSFYGLYWDEQL